jgi:tRNA threonylcarbamoyladenosine biosynthesis protein TsaE
VINGSAEKMAAGGALDFISHGAQQTQRLGARLGELLSPGDVLLLEGELGAGKTVFAQGVAQGLGITDPVTSPTFTLIHEYRGRLPLYHVDLYRLGNAAEAADLGIEDYLYGEGVTLVEWPGRAEGVLPSAHLVVSLRPITETKRGIRMVPTTAHYARLLAAFKRRAFGL